MSRFAIYLLLLLSSAASASSDLKSAMKRMKLEFKQAAQAQTVEEMQIAVDKFTLSIEYARQVDHPPEKQALYQQGFDKLTLSIDAINQELEQGDLAGAKQELKVIDALREEYHDKRNPSIWSKIFG